MLPFFLTFQNNAIFLVYPSIVNKVSFFIFSIFKLSELVKNYTMKKKIQNFPIILSKITKVVGKHSLIVRQEFSWPK
jgi:hypothetical protein